MYSIVALALAMTDSTVLDSVKVQEQVKARPMRTISLPTMPIVGKVAYSVKAPEKLTTCYSSQYGSCWSEN